MPYLNRPDDWELWPYSDPAASRPFRIVFAWCDLLLGFITTPYMYGRIFFHKNSPITAPPTRAAILKEYLLARCSGERPWDWSHGSTPGTGSL